MTEPDGPPYDAFAYRRLNRTARAWVAAIREAILKKMVHDKFSPMAVLEADLRQCERLLAMEKVFSDAVFHIWRREGVRHGILWARFEPKPNESRRGR